MIVKTIQSYMIDLKMMILSYSIITFSYIKIHFINNQMIKRKYLKSLFLIISIFLLFINSICVINAAGGLVVNTTNNQTPSIPSGYYFSPRWISGVTTVTLCKAPSGYKWVNPEDTGYYQLQTTASKAQMPSNDYKNKLYVIYHNVGTWSDGEQIITVDMIITITNWNASAKRIEFGKNYIGVGNASGTQGGIDSYINVSIEYVKNNTHDLIEGFKGHQVVGDMDYWSDTKQCEWLKTGTNSTSKGVLVHQDDYSKFNLTKLSENMIGVKSGNGGTSNSDGVSLIYYFTNPKHTITWYGGFLRFNLACPNKEFEIIYMPNGGTGKMETTRVKYGISTTTRKSEFERKGYTQKGWIVYRTFDNSWYTKTDAGGKWITSKPKDSSLFYLYNNPGNVSSTASCGIVYFYANWVPNILTIKVHSNGGILQNNKELSDDIIDISNFEYGNEIFKEEGFYSYSTINSSFFMKKEGYKATGYWKLNSLDSNIQVNEKDLFNKVEDLAHLAGFSLESGNVILDIYAMWDFINENYQSDTILSEGKRIYARFISNRLLIDGKKCLSTLAYNSLWRNKQNYHDTLIHSLSLNNQDYLYLIQKTNQSISIKRR